MPRRYFWGFLKCCLDRIQCSVFSLEGKICGYLRPHNLQPQTFGSHNTLSLVIVMCIDWAQQNRSHLGSHRQLPSRGGWNWRLPCQASRLRMGGTSEGWPKILTWPGFPQNKTKMESVDFLSLASKIPEHQLHYPLEVKQVRKDRPNSRGLGRGSIVCHHLHMSSSRKQDERRDPWLSVESNHPQGELQHHFTLQSLFRKWF